MIYQNRKHVSFTIVLIMLLVLFLPVSGVGAYITASKDIRIGLFYKNGAKDTTLNTVSLSSIGGIEIGINSGGHYTKIIESPQMVNATVDSGVSGYHIKIGEESADIANIQENLNAYISMGLEAFPVCRPNGMWQIWEGCYLSKQDTENAIASKITPKLGAGTYSIVYPSDSRIIIKYSNGLASIASESAFSFLTIKSTFHGDPKTVDVNGKRYRNAIELRKYPDSLITVINELSLPYYLDGVVPLEIGTTDTPFEALKAQAVAARTYALNNTKHQDYGFNLCNSTCCQVYGGYDVENLATNNAIKATEGMVVTYGGELAQLFYFASSGGITASSQNVWSSKIPYLQSVEDPYEQTRHWSYTFTAEEISNHLKLMGKDVGIVSNINIDQISDSGRVLKLRVIGNKGTVFFTKVYTRGAFPSYLPSQMFTVVTGSGYTVRGGGGMLTNMSVSGARVKTANGSTTVNSNSNVTVMNSKGQLIKVNTNNSDNDNYSVAGAGHGHGVGMCQLGAIGMAEAGYTYIDILQHYFRGTQVEKVELY